jgi:aspartate aminotransferase-like enzyme
MNLRIPGPTPLPAAVRRAAGAEVIDHRGRVFEDLLIRCSNRLREFYQTQSDVLVLTGSGTGGLEAALVNVLSPGDEVLAVSTGHFGERFAAIARAFGARVTQLDVPWGQAHSAGTIAKALNDNSGIRLLLTTHNETSTGVLNDLAPVAELLERLGSRRPLWLVDAVSSLGATDLPMDKWGCDVVISASQKAWMAPPGLSFLAVSERAWERIDTASCPRYYWDLREAKRYARKGQTPFTPAVSALAGLGEALELMADEGLPAIVARHRRQASQMRSGLRQLGFGLLAQGECASPTVTAALMPKGLAATDLKRRLLAEQGVVIAAGMGELKDKVIRVAHMGFCTDQDVQASLDAIEAVQRTAQTAGTVSTV